MAIIAIAAIVGYKLWNKPHQNIKNAVAIKTTAILLYNSLAVDCVRMKSIYTNKIVLISGEVKEVSKNQKNQQIILLKTNTSGGFVNCTMEENVSNIKTGDRIRIKGICIGYVEADSDMGLSGDVFLIRCYLSS